MMASVTTTSENGCATGLGDFKGHGGEVDHVALAQNGNTSTGAWRRNFRSQYLQWEGDLIKTMVGRESSVGGKPGEQQNPKETPSQEENYHAAQYQRQGNACQESSAPSARRSAPGAESKPEGRTRRARCEPV